jgi:hypothetical protein
MPKGPNSIGEGALVGRLVAINGEVSAAKDF